MKQKQQAREMRRMRVRARVKGESDRPRLNVFRSLRSMYAQIIDDATGKTLVSVNSLVEGVSGDAGERKGKVAASYLAGRALAEKAKKANITTVVFDRAGYRYHGRIKALADGARDGGLVF